MRGIIAFRYFLLRSLSGWGLVPCLLFLLCSSPGEAQLFYLDAGGSGGYTKPSVPAGLEPPKLLQWGVQGDLGLYLNSFFIFGLGAEYRKVQHLSKVNPNLGNYQGTLVAPLYPFIGIDLDALMFKVDLKALANYELTNKKEDGTTVIFKAPFGARFSLLFFYNPYLYWGAFYEHVTFQKEYQRGLDLTEEREITPGQSLHQVGITLTFVLKAFKGKEDMIRSPYSSPYE